MVRFKFGLDGECIAARLALCLLMGLRLVSASLSESLQRGSSSRHEDLNQQSHIAPRATNWDMDVIDSFSAASRKEDGSESAMREEPCEGGEYVRQKREFEERHKPSAEAAGDHAANSSPPSSTSTFQELDSNDGTSSSPPNSQSGPSNNSTASLTPNNPASPLTGSNSDSNNVSISPSSSNNNITVGDSSSSSSSRTPPGQDGPSSTTPGALPNIDYGNTNSNNNNNNNNPSSSQPPNVASPAPSDGTVSTESQQPSSDSSSQSGKAVAAGVTVPIGVIALGLAALVILRKQRQRRSRMQGLGGAGKDADEEKAAVPAAPHPPPSTSTPLVDAPPAVHEDESQSAGHQETPAVAVSDSVNEAQNPFSRRASDEASNASHSTIAHAASVPHLPLPSSVGTEFPLSQSISVPASPAAPTSPVARSPNVARGKSLKRKPVPALLEPLEPANKT